MGRITGNIREGLAQERIRISNVVKKNKLGRAIVDRILDPILEALSIEFEKVVWEIGEFVVNHIRQNMMQSPRGGEYTIVLVEGSEGSRTYTELGKYRASAPGQPPASFKKGQFGVPTGTMFNSIAFDIDENGLITVGILKSPETEYESLYFIGGKIFIGKGANKKTSVEVYANALDVGASSGGWAVDERPWFREVLNELRPIIKQKIRDAMYSARNKATRSKGAKAAINFRVTFQDQKRLNQDFDDDY